MNIGILSFATGDARTIREGVASGRSVALPHIQTVLGPIEPAALGFTLPHEHTQIALWHIADRWDYWQLTRDEPVILAELKRFRSTGGSGLVDLTLPGVGRDPLWLRHLAETSGLRLVMGCGWYRTAYYPAEARIDRRSVDDLADELVREATDGVGDSGVGHADSYPVLDHHLEIIRRGASVEFDFLGMSFTPTERHGEGQVVELVCELLARGHADRILLSQDVCHDSQLKRYEGNGYVYLAETFLPRLRAAGVSAAEIDTITVANPRRLLTVG